MGEFLQVSELVKLIIIIVLARFFAEVRTDELSLQDLIKAGLMVGLPLAFDFEAARFGTALVLMPMLVVGAFLAGLQWKHAAAIVLIGVLMLPAGWHFLKPYQKERVTSFLASRGRRERLRLPGFAVEDSGGLGRFLGERFRQRQPESTWVHSGPVLRLHHVGVGGRTGIQRRAACFGAVHGVVCCV